MFPELSGHLYLKAHKHATNVRWGIAEVPLQQGIGKGLIWNIMYWAGHLCSRKIKLNWKRSRNKL